MEDSFNVHSVAVQYSQPVFLPAVHKPDKLAERINSLSHARDYRLETVPEGLIDSLPTEGLLKVETITVNSRCIVFSTYNAIFTIFN